MQSAKKRKQKQKIERILTAANIFPDSTPEIEDDLLLAVSGIGPKTLREIRAWWPPQNGDEEAAPREPSPDQPPVAVYDFGLKTSSEKAKRAGLWHDMGLIAPERWGPLHLRLRSLESRVVIVRVDQIEAELLADTSGQEVLLGKIREEVNSDTGDRALSRAVVAASFGLMQRRTREQELEYNWRRAAACIRGLRGAAVFGGEMREFTGGEPEEAIQRLLEPVLRVSSQHAVDVVACVTAMVDADHAEICRLGEDFVVTELRAAGLRDSVARILTAGRGR